jgi:hypothetical protein
MLKKKQLWISTNQIELELNETIFLVCADDNIYLSKTNHGGKIREVLESCKSYDVDIDAQKLSRPYVSKFPYRTE